MTSSSSKANADELLICDLYPPLPHHLQELLRKKRRLRRTWQQTRCPTQKKELNKISEKVKIGVKTFIEECKKSREESQQLSDQLSSNLILPELNHFSLDHPDPEAPNHDPSKEGKGDSNVPPSKLNQLSGSSNFEQNINQPRSLPKTGSNRQSSKLNQLPGSSKLEQSTIRDEANIRVKAIKAEYKKSLVAEDDQLTLDELCDQLSSTLVLPELKPFPHDHPDPRLRGRVPPTLDRAPDNFQWSELYEARK